MVRVFEPEQPSQFECFCLPKVGPGLDLLVPGRIEVPEWVLHLKLGQYKPPRGLYAPI
jgi:hypothetical protein